MQICASEKPKVKLEKVFKKMEKLRTINGSNKTRIFFWTKATKISLENLVM